MINHVWFSIKVSSDNKRRTHPSIMWLVNCILSTQKLTLTFKWSAKNSYCPAVYSIHTMFSKWMTLKTSYSCELPICLLKHVERSTWALVTRTVIVQLQILCNNYSKIKDHPVGMNANSSYLWIIFKANTYQTTLQVLNHKFSTIQYHLSSWLWQNRGTVCIVQLLLLEPDNSLKQATNSIDSYINRKTSLLPLLLLHP